MLKFELKQCNWTQEHIFCTFFGAFGTKWVGLKMPKSDFKNYLITLKNIFLTSNHIFMLHVIQTFCIFIIYFEQKYMLGRNLISNAAVFIIRVLEKNALRGSCHHFQEINFLHKGFWRTKKTSGQCL